MLTEGGLPRGVEGRVGLEILDDVEHVGLRPGPGHERLIDEPIVRLNAALVPRAHLPQVFDVVGSHELPRRLLGLLVAVAPERAKRLLGVLRHALLVGVGVLDDEALHPIRGFFEQPESDGPADVVDVKDVRGDPQLLEQVADEGGEIIERVAVIVPRRRLGMAEADEVGGDEMEAVRERGDQLAKHGAARGEAVQQHDRRRGRIAGFPVEHPAALHGGGAVTGRDVMLR